MRTSFSILILAAVLGPWCVIRAQDAADTKPLSFGGFENQGSLTAGYRFTDIKGYRPMYSQLVNLRKGPRLLDFNLFGRAKSADSFADTYSISLSSLGGDPFPTPQVNGTKNKLYDFRAIWRQS